MVILRNAFTQQGVEGIDDIFAHDAFDGVPGMTKGLLGAGRYRPLSIATFAIEWELFGLDPGDEVEVTAKDSTKYIGRITAFETVEEQPSALVTYTDKRGTQQTDAIQLSALLTEQTALPLISHALNVLFFAACVLLLFLWLTELFSQTAFRSKEIIPLVTAVLFAAHPIHVEAVANIKGRDEILALLFGVLALLWTLRYAVGGRSTWLVLAAPAFLLALLAKESAYPLVAVVPAAALVFLKGDSRRRMMMASIPLLLIAVMGVLVRNRIVGFSLEESTELMNNPFLDATGDQRLATIFFVLGKYLRLLVFPHPLTNDYYPYHVALTTFGDPLTLAALVLNIGLGVYGVWLVFKKRHPLGFAILFYFLTLSIVSNLVLPVGTFMSERLVFIPSIGYCLALAWLLWWPAKAPVSAGRGVTALKDIPNTNPIGVLLMVVILAGYGFKTVTRNADWKDNFTLFTTDVKVSSGSAKANNAAGGVLFQAAKSVTDTAERRLILTQSMQYLERAVEIHPKYKPAWITLGNDYFYVNKGMDKVVKAYQRSGSDQAYKNLAIIANQAIDISRFDDAIYAYTALHEAFPTSAEYLVGLGRAYGQGRNDVNKAIQYLSQAVQLEPRNKEALKHLGTSHAIRAQLLTFSGRGAEAAPDLIAAISYFERAETLDPNDAVLLNNIATAYAQLGRNTEAELYRQKAARLGSR
jgi:cytochrome c-type biogenesis protein CcmH/NrfG